MMSIKDGHFDPGYDLLFKRQGAPGREPIAEPLVEPPFMCGSDYSLIAEQKLNYTVGIPSTPTVEKFANNNKPAVANNVINFENHKSINTNPVSGQISMAGITGYGNKPDEVIFPGKGLGLVGYMHQTFPMAQNNYAVVQCTARISKANGFCVLDPGPENSPVDGMVASFGLAHLDLHVYDPQTDSYKQQSNLTTVFTFVGKGDDRSYSTGLLLGNGSRSGGGFNNFLSMYGMPQSVDLTVNIRYQPSTKPIFVNVFMETYAMIIEGNEKISGVVIHCQNADESTPVLTFSPQRTPLFPTSPFVIEQIRLCGI
ncbi:MAG: hypothetical protein ABJA70_22320 [Chryseolinea sp.]